jgi:S-adenosylmethionine synthetase
VFADTYGTGKLPDDEIADLVRDVFELKPKGIISTLKLRRPIYRKTCNYGHFGRKDPDFLWEATDKADTLREKAGSGTSR